MGYEGIWVAFAVSNVAGAAIAFGWYIRGGWRDADLTERGGPPAEPSESPDPEPPVDD
jgi:hypothetical protein